MTFFLFVVYPIIPSYYLVIYLQSGRRLTEFLQIKTSFLYCSGRFDCKLRVRGKGEHFEKEIYENGEELDVL